MNVIFAKLMRMVDELVVHLSDFLCIFIKMRFNGKVMPVDKVVARINDFCRHNDAGCLITQDGYHTLTLKFYDKKMGFNSDILSKKDTVSYCRSIDRKRIRASAGFITIEELVMQYGTEKIICMWTDFQPKPREKVYTIYQTFCLTLKRADAPGFVQSSFSQSFKNSEHGFWIKFPLNYEAKVHGSIVNTSFSGRIGEIHTQRGGRKFQLIFGEGEYTLSVDIITKEVSRNIDELQTTEEDDLLKFRLPLL